MPVHPEWYSDEFGRLLKRAGLRRITLHDSRHTTLTLMEHAGVPISILSKWAGHYDAAFTQRTYVHASDDDLEQGCRALAAFTRSPSSPALRHGAVGSGLSPIDAPWSARNSVQAVRVALARWITSGPCSVRNLVHSSTAASAMSRASYSLLSD